MNLTALVNTILYFAVALIVCGAGLLIFQRVTRFQDWREIGRGNLAAALASGGQVMGLAHVIHTAIVHGESLWGTLLWAGVGFGLQVAGYLLFDLLTPFQNDQEIERGNVAVGALLAMITVSLAHVVAAVIT